MRKLPQNSQGTLPNVLTYKDERDLARRREVERMLQLHGGGLSGDKLFAARILIFCGLPINEVKGMEPVVRKAMLADGSWVRVSFIRTHPHVPLPYRADRTMVMFLTNKAYRAKSPLLRWEHANEYMRLFDMDPNAGKNYRAVQERFTRIAYMDIMCEHLDAKDHVVEHWKCPLIDHARISAEVDEAGNWKPSQSVAAMLEGQQSIHFGMRFFVELQGKGVPIPMEIIRAADRKYRILDYMIFLYWRAFAAQSSSFIPWRYLQQQFDCEDSNTGRWRQQFMHAYRLLRSLPDPISQIRTEISSSGVLVHPLPPGTRFFEDHPKLGLLGKGE